MNGQRETETLRKALRLFAGEEVLAQVEREGEAALAVRGESIRLSLLFLDVASFTQPQPHLSGHDVQLWMNNYCETVSRAIARSGGVLDTFIGDAASAWYGSRGEPKHEALACRGAAAILDAVDAQNQEGRAKGYPQLSVAIGIHSGVVLLGNFGSSTRLRYTAMGDNVNLASRLCGMAMSHYHVPVVISEETRKGLDGTFQVAQLDAVHVKGREGKMGLYRVAF